MFSYECVFAAVLVTALPESLNPEELRGYFLPLRQAVITAAVQAEILDPRETTFVVAHKADFGGDLKMLQGRFRELCNAPCVEECQRFPDRPLVAQFLGHNRLYRQDLCAQLALDLVHSDELRTAIAETDHLHQIWDTLRDARSEYYYVTVRRQSLQILREILGADAFYSGEMPPHLPLWRFAVQSN